MDNFDNNYVEFNGVSELEQESALPEHISQLIDNILAQQDNQNKKISSTYGAINNVTINDNPLDYINTITNEMDIGSNNIEVPKQFSLPDENSITFYEPSPVKLSPTYYDESSLLSPTSSLISGSIPLSPSQISLPTWKNTSQIPCPEPQIPPQFYHANTSTLPDIFLQSNFCPTNVNSVAPQMSVIIQPYPSPTSGLQEPIPPTSSNTENNSNELPPMLLSPPSDEYSLLSSTSSQTSGSIPLSPSKISPPTWEYTSQTYSTYSPITINPLAPQMCVSIQSYSSPTSGSQILNLQASQEPIPSTSNNMETYSNMRRENNKSCKYYRQRKKNQLQELEKEKKMLEVRNRELKVELKFKEKCVNELRVQAGLVDPGTPNELCPKCNTGDRSRSECLNKR